MIKKFALVTALFLSACNQGSSSLSIAEIEQAGFKKNQQQLFQMIGATDGWSGKWNNEIVEVFTFQETDLENNPFYTSINIESNPSGWTDKCIHKNVILLSKGTESCLSLNEL